MSSKRYPEEFKIEAVKQVTERGYPVVEVATRIGVSQHSLYEWVKRYSVSEPERLETQTQKAVPQACRPADVPPHSPLLARIAHAFRRFRCRSPACHPRIRPRRHAGVLRLWRRVSLGARRAGAGAACIPGGE